MACARVRGIGTFVRRSKVLLPYLLAALAVVVPAQAQTTIRFEPLVSLFPIGGTGSVEIFIDNVPIGGLQGFDLTFEFSTGVAAGTLTCLEAKEAIIDPDLAASLGNNLVNQLTFAGFKGRRWRVETRNPAGVSPSGTVRLGSITFKETGSNSSLDCRFDGATGIFMWNRSITSFLRRLDETHLPFQVYDDGAWVLGSPPDIDLVIGCTRLAPPDDYLSDADIVTLDCTVENQGTSAVPSTIGVGVELSHDAQIGGSGGYRIDHETVAAPPPAGSTQVLLTGSPIFPVIPGQVWYVCAQTDINSAFTDPSFGRVFETNESNNGFCLPVSILAPTRDLAVPTVTASPGPLDPNAFRAGSTLEVTYTVASLGAAGVRGHRNAVYLSADQVIGDPGDQRICDLLEEGSPSIGGRGEAITRTFGTSEDFDPDSDLVCEIPFNMPAGGYYLGVVADVDDAIVELDETNNSGSVPLQIDVPVDAIVELVDPAFSYSSSLQIFGPGGKWTSLRIASVRDLAEYELTLRWSPAPWLRIEYPNFYVDFTYFLEQNGRNQHCTRSLNNASGELRLTCTSSGPGAGASSAGNTTLAYIYFTAAHPGIGGSTTLTVERAVDSSGQDVVVRTSSGSFSVTGPPDLVITSASIPTDAVPGVPFEVGYELQNQGFGSSRDKIRTDVILSTDTTIDITAGDRILCFFTEPVPVEAFGVLPRTLTDCVIPIDIRPGIQTLAIAVTGEPPALHDLRLEPRVLTLGRMGERRFLDAYLPPGGLGGSAGSPVASFREFDARSVATIKTSILTENFLLGLSGKRPDRLLTAYPLPGEGNERGRRLGRVRVPPSDRKVLGGADVDGDGEDELILLERRRKGDALDFRRVGIRDGRPIVCVTAGVTGLLGSRILDAAGIRFDSDPNDDEIAVLTRDGGRQVLTIYDVEFDPNGPPPPSSTLCTGYRSENAPPARIMLTPLASDESFDLHLDRVKSLCVLDHGLDGTDEIVALAAGDGRSSRLGIFLPPMTLSGSSTLIADDQNFGRKRGLALEIACTR